MLSAVGSAMSGIVSSVISGMSNVVSSVTSGVSRAVSAARGFIGQMVSVGRDLIMGLINGIRAMAGQVASAARNVVMGAVNAAKSALHIGSPSKLFKQYGVWTMEGLGIGINKEGKNVIAGMGNMAQSITDTFNTKLQIPDIQSNLKTLTLQLIHKSHIHMNSKQIRHNVLYVLKWVLIMMH